MNYNVGFFGCDQNKKKEVFPVQAWVVASSNTKLLGGEKFVDPIPPKFLETTIVKEKENELDELLKALELEEQAKK